MEIQAIETLYKGYHFRSRIEARWAVFYDSIGIEWEYEREGFELPSGRYLPDFYIPHLDCWIEIKGKVPTDQEEQKAFDLYDMTRQPIYIFFGQIPHIVHNGLYFSFEHNDESAYTIGDTRYYWCQCPACGRFGIEFDGRGARVCGDKCCPESDKLYNFATPALLTAYDAARSARF